MSTLSYKVTSLQLPFLSSTDLFLRDDMDPHLEMLLAKHVLIALFVCEMSSVICYFLLFTYPAFNYENRVKQAWYLFKMYF